MREFDLSDILSVTTGRLVSSRHMDGVHDILEYMTDSSLFTHQLPRALERCCPVLLERYPHLSKERLASALHRLEAALHRLEAALHVSTAAQQAAVCQAWVTGLAHAHGRTLPVPCLPQLAEEFSAPIGDMLSQLRPDQELLIFEREDTC